MNRKDEHFEKKMIIMDVFDGDRGGSQTVHHHLLASIMVVYRLTKKKLPVWLLLMGQDYKKV